MWVILGMEWRKDLYIGRHVGTVLDMPPLAAVVFNASFEVCFDLCLFMAVLDCKTVNVFLIF